MKTKVLLFLVILLVSCTAVNDTYTIDTIDGVKHIHNLAPAWGDEERIKLEFVQKIGKLEGDNENYQFFRPNDVVCDRSGNIYILDSGNNRIQKYNKSGRYLATIGRKGQGPGELESVNSMDIDDEENIYVAANYNKEVNKFSSDGKFINRLKCDNNLIGLTVIKTGKIVSGIGHTNPANLDKGKVMAFYSSDGEKIVEFGKRRIYQDMNMKQNGNSVDLENDGHNNVIAVFQYQNRIEKYNSEGKLLMSIDRVLPYEESEQWEWVSYLKDGKTKRYVKYSNFSYSSQIDSKGRYWVLTRIRQSTDEEYKDRSIRKENIVHFEIFNDEGILLGHVKYENPKDIYNVRIFGERLFFIDTRNEMAIYEYRIIEN